MIQCFVLFVLIVCVASEIPLSSSTDDDWYKAKLINNETGIFKTSRLHILRLKPNEDLIDCIWKYARVTNTTSMSIVSAVGSLIQTNIRYANQENSTSLNGYFEIVSLVGNIDYQYQDSTGSGHLHIAVSDGNGTTIGGHLSTGNIVYTTVEITMIEMVNAFFTRVLDSGRDGSGYYELEVFRTP